MSRRRTYRELPDIELGPELDQKVRAMTDIPDQDVAAAPVAFSWGPDQLAAVKRAAAIIGVPYQTYMKQVLLRQALTDIRQAKESSAGHEDSPGSLRDDGVGVNLDQPTVHQCARLDQR